MKVEVILGAVPGTAPRENRGDAELTCAGEIGRTAREWG